MFDVVVVTNVVCVVGGCTTLAGIIVSWSTELVVDDSGWASLPDGVIDTPTCFGYCPWVIDGSTINPYSLKLMSSTSALVSTGL